jgi:hypothetical protein
LRTAKEQSTTILVTETQDGHQIIDVRPLIESAGTEGGTAPKDQSTQGTSTSVTPQRAQQLFDLVNNKNCAPATAPMPCIPFMYPRDGCWARAHEMCRLMIQDGVQPEKVWINGGLHPASVNIHSCEVTWGWHVAPTLSVSVGNTTEVQVIDPSMFSTPVPLSVWVYAQKDPSASVVTTDATVYRRRGTYNEYDPDYSKTKQDLQTYRDALKLETAKFGPPPYSTCYTPDLYIRDNLEDLGLEPLVRGGISCSPDINHYRQELADPQNALGSPAVQMRDDLFEAIEQGQTNYIYVRVQNRGYAAGIADVDLYWTQPSTLPIPSKWHLIGSLQSSSAIAPNEFRVIGLRAWNDIPTKGHYCFVAVIGTAGDPKPDTNQIGTIDEFYRVIRQRNNVTWKNFDVANMFAGGQMQFDFQVQGWPRISCLSDLVLELSKLPVNAHVELRLLKRLTQGAVFEQLTQVSESQYHVRYKTIDGRSSICGMPLQTNDRAEATIYLSLPEDTPDGVYEFAVLQQINGREMGRITKRLIVGDYPYVANRNSGEVHEANCEWVHKMSPRNKIAYRELEQALKHGFNGCRYCLPEHNTG